VVARRPAVEAAKPVVEDHRICTRKVPFTTLSIPLDATIESLATNPDWKCRIDRVEDTRQVAACGGIAGDLQVFDAKICLPPPPALPPSTEGNCPQGTAYDTAGACCAAAVSPDAGCVIYEVPLRSCTQSSD
jgi:hypothetical protein